MPPKAAASVVAPARSHALSEETYFLYASLRLLMAQTGASPDWNLVTEALGGNVKKHTLYCRFDTMKKKATPGFGDNIPDINDLISNNFSGGVSSKKSASKSGAGKAKGKGATAAKGAAADDSAAENESDEKPVVKPKGRKRVAASDNTAAKKAKIEESSDNEQDAGSQDDVEKAV